MQDTYSSMPIIPQVPVMKSASEKAKTRKLSRSTNLRFSAPKSGSVLVRNYRLVPEPGGDYSQCRSSFAIHPTAAP